MHATKMLQQILIKNCPDIHAVRLSALMDNVAGLVRGQTLTVTGLGRSLPRAIHMKHGIKQSDRLMGNPHLSRERLTIYQAVARILPGQDKRPLIVVDWSDYTHDRRQQLLRASIPVGGRALTLYEEVHPLSDYGKARVHKQFLKTLQGVLPEGSCPVIMTDAGFIGPWFREVERLGWDYLGRLRQNVLYRKTAEKDWIKCKALYAQATATPCYKGGVELVRSNPFVSHLYVYKQTSRGRHKITKRGQRARSRHSKKNALREASPWLLVSSFGPEEKSAKQVIQLYRTRMQIEEAFRDIKNPRTGFALTQTRSRSAERLANLLLVGMLATLVVWLMGRLAEDRHLHYHYQANTVRQQRVLSLFYLGCLIAAQGTILYTQSEFRHALKLVQHDMKKQWE
jgi:hypothetical protein